MSAPFGSPGLFSPGAAPNASPYAPQFGLRQRHLPGSAPNASTGTAAGAVNENAHPNNAPAYGKFGSMAKVPAPPRVSLASGRAGFGRSATPQRQQPGAQSNNKRALAQTGGRDEQDDLSLWVVGYGYRSEAHFRALYRRLEGCGTITARRGGLACFGEGDAPDGGDNWVAVRYDSALCAQKALCQHGNFVSVGGSTMVIGTLSLSESEAAARLGINVGGSSQERVTLSRASYEPRNRRELRSDDEDVMLYEDERGDGTVGNEVKSGLDSLCGKVLAWFFMWDART
ncbi:hypothetical protein ACHAXT_013184 [Thalassiosira profunda]